MSDFTDAMSDLIATIDARVVELNAARVGAPDIVKAQITNELGYLAGMRAKYAAASSSGAFKITNSRFYCG